MTGRRHAIASLLMATFASVPVSAQRNATWDLAVHGMLSPSPSQRNLWFGGQIEGIRQSAMAVRASTDLLRAGPAHLRYSAQLLPIVALSNTEAYQILSGDGRTVYVLGGESNAFGFGIIPIGLDLGVDLGSRLRAQIGAAAGVLRFSHNVPVAGARARNFSAQTDALLDWRVTGDHGVQLGLRWSHISNGYTAYENPGIDNRMVVLGYRRTLRRKL